MPSEPPRESPGDDVARRRRSNPPRETLRPRYRGVEATLESRGPAPRAHGASHRPMAKLSGPMTERGATGTGSADPRREPPMTAHDQLSRRTPLYETHSLAACRCDD